MPSFLSFLSLATLLSAALANPIAGPEPKPEPDAEADALETLVKRGHFSIKQKEVQRTTPWTGTHAIRKTFWKYNAALPDGLLGFEDARIAEVENGTATVAAIPEQNDIEYLSPVKVAGETLMLDIDTGSSDLWVFSSHLTTSQKRGHSVYNPDISGRRLNGHTWKIRYGDLSYASGFVYADRVAVGPVTATSQAVEAATDISAQFVADVASDGLLGLAFGQLNQVTPQKQKTFFDTVKGSLAKPVFTAQLKKGQPGTYDFGVIDQSKYTGELFYVPADTSGGYWAITTEGFAIGNGARTQLRTVALPDTGTSLWYLPSAVVRAYWGQVREAVYDADQGGYVVPCNVKLPDVKVYLAGKSVTVAGVNMAYAKLGTIRNGEFAGQPLCFGGIQSDTGMPFSIFGDVFLKGLFVVYDQGSDGNKARIGFAQQAP